MWMQIYSLIFIVLGTIGPPVEQNLPAYVSQEGPETKKTKTGCIAKRMWTSEEIKVVLEECHKHITHPRSLPGKNECEIILKRHKVLRGRSWTNIKDYVRNHKLKAAKI